MPIGTSPNQAQGYFTIREPTNCKAKKLNNIIGESDRIGACLKKDILRWRLASEGLQWQ